MLGTLFFCLRTLMLLASFLLIASVLAACGEGTSTETAERPFTAAETVEEDLQPSGPDMFTQVSAGRYFTCGLKAGGTLSCWGDVERGVAHMVGGYWSSLQFQSVAVGSDFACALTTGGRVWCAGDYTGPDEDRDEVPPAGPYVSLSAAGDYSCAVKENGSVECWGLAHYGQTSPPLKEAISADRGGDQCGTFITERDGTQSGNSVCWNSVSGPTGELPDWSYDSVDSGEKLTCAVDDEGSAACWGYEYMSIPNEAFLKISVGGAGQSELCGLKTDGTIACWGYWSGEKPPVPEEQFSDVSVGVSNACGVRRDGNVGCWNAHSQTWSDEEVELPAGTFKQISVGHEYACAVATDGTVECWGNDEYGQASPPAP